MDTRLRELIDKYKNEKGNLMPILQGIQDIYGYLSFDNLKIISEELDMSLEKIYGVATFYSQFKFVPKAKHMISVCLGTVCYVKGSSDILDEVKKILNIGMGESTKDGMFSIENTRCLGCCSLAPVMMIGDKVYSQVKKEDVREILDSYRRIDA
jgi:NADH-quinone oxidoreductase E subunit